MSALDRQVADLLDCDEPSTVLDACDEIIDKATGTNQRIVDQIMREDDCDVCPPGFLAATADLVKVATALRLLMVDRLQVEETPSLASDVETDREPTDAEYKREVAQALQPAYDLMAELKASMARVAAGREGRRPLTEEDARTAGVIWDSRGARRIYGRYDLWSVEGSGVGMCFIDIERMYGPLTTIEPS